MKAEGGRTGIVLVLLGVTSTVLARECIFQDRTGRRIVPSADRHRVLLLRSGLAGSKAKRTNRGGDLSLFVGEV